MFVTVYDKTDGAIMRCTEVFDPIDAPLQVGAGEAWIEGQSDPNRQVVSNGVIVDKPQAEIDAYEIDVAWKGLRRDRNRRLAASDWTQVPDAPVDQSAWASYRQELRDLPANTDDPRDIVWPQEP